MNLNHGAIAEGEFYDLGRVSSLGKAGVDKHGNLKHVACSSESSAQLRALRCVANRVRHRRGDGTDWIEFRDLSKLKQDVIIGEVASVVQWEFIGPGLSKCLVSQHIFQNAIKKAVA